MPGGWPLLRGPRGLVRQNWYLAKPFSLTGGLVYANGDPVFGARVDLFDFGTNRWIAWTTSDSDGVYTFAPPNNLPYWVSFFLAGSPNYFGRSDVLVPT